MFWTAPASSQALIQVRFNGLDLTCCSGWTANHEVELDIDHARDGEVMIAYAMNGQQLPVPMGSPCGSLLQEAGEPVEHVYFPHEGMISLLAVMSDGQGIETATVGTRAWLEPCRGFRIRQGFTRAVVQSQCGLTAHRALSRGASEK